MITKTKGDWKQKYEALDDIRKLSKFHFTVLVTRLTPLVPFLVECITSLRSNLSKNSLLLVQELFREERDKEMAEFTDGILTSILEKTVFEKAFIAKEAKQAMKDIVNHCQYPQVVKRVAAGCKVKSGPLAELTMSYL